MESGETHENGVTVSIHTSKVDHHWSAWAGPLDDLKRIGVTFEELAAKACADQLALVDDKADDADRQRDEIRKRWQVRAEASHPVERKSLYGPPLAVLEMCDPKLLETFTLMAGTDRYGSFPELFLTMKRKETIDQSWEKPGVALRIKGRSYGWVQEADNRLSGAIRRCVPWWRFLRAPWIAPVVYVVIAVGSGALIGSPFGLGPVTWGGNIGFYFGLYVMPWLARKRLPAFEVVPVGGRPIGARVTGVVGSLLSQIAIGVAIALVFHKK